MKKTTYEKMREKYKEEYKIYEVISFILKVFAVIIGSFSSLEIIMRAIIYGGLSIEPKYVIETFKYFVYFVLSYFLLNIFSLYFIFKKHDEYLIKMFMFIYKNGEKKELINLFDAMIKDKKINDGFEKEYQEIISCQDKKDSLLVSN